MCEAGACVTSCLARPWVAPTIFLPVGTPGLVRSRSLAAAWERSLRSLRQIH